MVVRWVKYGDTRWSCRSGVKVPGSTECGMVFYWFGRKSEGEEGRCTMRGPYEDSPSFSRVSLRVN